MARHFGGINQNRQADKARAVVLASVFFVIIFSVLAFFLLSTSRSSTESEPTKVAVQREAEIRMIEVLVPIREIPPGTLLEPTMFRRDSRPGVGVSDGVVKDFEEIQGQYARSLIVRGQPLHRELLTAVKPVNQLTANIPEGYRAVTIRVDKTTSVEGFVRPGARVDVLWTSNIRGQPGITAIVQNAKVLSAERMTEQAQNNPGAPVPTTVTLLVSTPDASKIQLASTTGSLNLQLRGDEDSGKDSSAVNGSLTVSDLLGRRDTDGSVPQNVDGTVTIGGQKYLLINGDMVPASRSNRGKR